MSKGKQNFFLDFDLTIADSISAFCDAYNILYKDHPEFQPADPNKITSYDFRCICPLLKTKEDKFAIWSNKILFEHMKLIDENTYDVLIGLNEKYRLIICSIGTPKNIAYKSLWLEENLPFIQDYVLLADKSCVMSKSFVNMEGSLFMDDIPSNLESTNAEVKVLFGKIYSWNKGWRCEHLFNWKEVGERFL